MKKHEMPMNLQFFADESAAGTAATPENTPPQAATVDTESIVAQASAKASEAAEKKMEAVFKSMLQQQGLDTETIASMTADWKAKNKPVEQSKPEENADFKALAARLEALEATNTKAQAELTDRKQLDVLKAANIPAEQLDFYQFKIGKLVTDGVTFEEAAAQYIKDNPPQIRPPDFATGSGKSVPGMTLDDYKKMPPAEKMKLKSEKPALYGQFKQALGFK